MIKKLCESIVILENPTQNEQNRWSAAMGILFPIEDSTPSTQPILSSHYLCPNCDEQVREPSPQSGRAWCNTCEDYILAEKAINA